MNEPYVSRVFTPEGGFTAGVEGPACDADGNLYAVNFERDGTIGRVTPSGIASVFLVVPDGGSAQGIRFDADYNMMVADRIKHRILRVDMGTRQVDIVAEQPAMHQPNDLAIATSGVMYVSDPDWATSSGQLWRVDPDGTTTLLEGNMGTTNGIEVGMGDHVLYVNESRQLRLWAYELLPDGFVGDKHLLVQFDGYSLDGMRCDKDGTLFVTRTGKGTIARVSRDGVELAEVQLHGLKCTNIAFGGPDGRTCYVTMADNGSIETFRSEVPGRSWNMG